MLTHGHTASARNLMHQPAQMLYDQRLLQSRRGALCSGGRRALTATHAPCGFISCGRLSGFFMSASATSWSASVKSSQPALKSMAGSSTRSACVICAYACTAAVDNHDTVCWSDTERRYAVYAARTLCG